MKRFLLLMVMAASVLAAMAQRDVTKFLGIPVDGTKAEMRKKLIAKGFTPTKLPGYDFLEGEFNGEKVNVHIVTNNNKVYRIYVCDSKPRSEADIKIRYNNLTHQFQQNNRYISLEDYSIPDDERISYEMMVHKKRYQAIFYRDVDAEKMDTLALRQKMRDELLKKYTAEQLGNPTEEMEKEYNSILFTITKELIQKKPVWFTISESGGEYFIAMFYDNEYNHANGEDL